MEEKKTYQPKHTLEAKPISRRAVFLQKIMSWFEGILPPHLPATRIPGQAEYSLRDMASVGSEEHKSIRKPLRPSIGSQDYIANHQDERIDNQNEST